MAPTQSFRPLHQMAVVVVGRITTAHQIRVLMEVLEVVLLVAPAALAIAAVLLQVDKVMLVVLANQILNMLVAAVVVQVLLVQQGLALLRGMAGMVHLHQLMAHLLLMLVVVVVENTIAAALVVAGELAVVAMLVQR